MEKKSKKKEKKKKSTEDSGPSVGSVALELQQSTEQINSIDLQREIHKGHTSDDSFESQILEAYNRGRKEFIGTFFIVVVFKKERLLHNVVRQYFFPRKSCPTPQFDQIVYKYNSEDDALEFIWVIPDKATCHALTTYESVITPEHAPLVKFSKDFLGGKLDRLCANLNNEKWIG